MSTPDESPDATHHVLALAASRYAEAKSRADDASQTAWQKVIYGLVASDRSAQV
jgi:hypothetical protein